MKRLLGLRAPVEQPVEQDVFLGGARRELRHPRHVAEGGEAKRAVQVAIAHGGQAARLESHDPRLGVADGVQASEQLEVEGARRLVERGRVLDRVLVGKAGPGVVTARLARERAGFTRETVLPARVKTWLARVTASPARGMNAPDRSTIVGAVVGLPGAGFGSRGGHGAGFEQENPPDSTLWVSATGRSVACLTGTALTF
ncbi:MAG TPA: hypothetical protein VMB75_02730 [Rhodocyclaceae bacterium]|nr:hypothetical protein [Rhodocyclaceae bacterium]